MKKLWYIGWAALALSLVACAGVSTAAPTVAPTPAPESAPAGAVIAEGDLRPDPAVELSFAQGGLVAETLAHPGDTLAAGDVIARVVGGETAAAELAAGRQEETLAQQALDELRRNALAGAGRAEAALIAAQKSYESARSGWSLGNKDDASDLDLALDDYLSAEEDYRAARKDLDALLGKDADDRERVDAQKDVDRESATLAESYAGLQSASADFDQPLSQKQADLLAAIGALEAARERQGRLGADNLDPDALAAAQVRLEAAQAHTAAAQAALALTEIRAPFAGVLLRLDLKPGETALPGAPAAYLANTARWTVKTTDLAEIDIARVALGQSASVQLDAFPGERFSARVTAIDPVGREHLGDRVYQATLTLDEPDPRFLWNMTATVAIDTE